MERMWINQPSTMNMLHHLHGTNVLAIPDGNNMMRIYFLDGTTISQQVHKNFLSNGWISHKIRATPDIEVKQSLEDRVKAAAESTVIDFIKGGNWIMPDYASRFKVPPEFMKEVWALVDADGIKKQMALIIERDLAEKVIGLMAAELSTDIKKVLSDTERRESIRTVVRDNLDTICKTGLPK